MPPWVTYTLAQAIDTIQYNKLSFTRAHYRLTNSLLCLSFTRIARSTIRSCQWQSFDAKKIINKQLTEIDDWKDAEVLTILACIITTATWAIWYDMKGREDITHLKINKLKHLSGSRSKGRMNECFLQLCDKLKSLYNPIQRSKGLYNWYRVTWHSPEGERYITK